MEVMTKNRLLRKLAWAGLLAVSTMAARRVAAAVWRRTAHEEPPVKA